MNLSGVFLIYLLLNTGRKQPYLELSYNEIAKIIGTPYRQNASRIVKYLEESLYINVERNGLKKNKYRLTQIAYKELKNGQFTTA